MKDTAKTVSGRGREGGAAGGILVLVLALVVVVWGLKALRGGNPETAVGRMAQDVALTLEEASLAGIRGDAEPAVVRKQLLKRLERENNEWTERNIRNNPGLYLDHCEEMLGQLKEECADALFAARLESARQSQAAGEARASAESSRRFLTAAAEAESAGVFPVKIGAYEYTGAMFTNAVKKADREAERAENAEKVHASAAARARELTAFLEGTLEDVERELDSIALKRTSLRAETARQEAEEVKRRIGQLMSGVRLAGGDDTPPAKLDAPRGEGLEGIFKRNRAKTEGVPAE